MGEWRNRTRWSLFAGIAQWVCDMPMGVQHGAHRHGAIWILIRARMYRFADDFLIIEQNQFCGKWQALSLASTHRSRCCMRRSPCRRYRAAPPRAAPREIASSRPSPIFSRRTRTLPRARSERQRIRTSASAPCLRHYTAASLAARRPAAPQLHLVSTRVLCAHRANLSTLRNRSSAGSSFASSRRSSSGGAIQRRAKST